MSKTSVRSSSTGGGGGGGASAPAATSSNTLASRKRTPSGGPSGSDEEPRVAVRKEHVLVVGRYLFVFRPVLDSILDTIFWGDGYKSVAHLFLFSYLTYHHLCGVRFMFLLLAFHTFMVAGRPSKVSDADAIAAFKLTMADLTIILKRYKPSLRHTWPALLVMVLLACVLEMATGVSLWEVFDSSIGPLTILVILTCYGLVDPRYTIHYHTHHSRTSSKDSGTTSSPASNQQTIAGAGAQDMSSTPDMTSAESEWDPLLASPLSLRGTTSFYPGPTPSGEWDDLLPPHPNIPVYMHKVLMLYTKGPNWVDWKISGDYVGRNHDVGWTVVKANINAIMIRNVTFDDAVSFIDDDPDGTKDNEKLNVWKYDILLGEFRRLQVIDRSNRVVHYVYKQLFFAVAPRDIPTYSTARELTPDETDYYGLCRPHANNKEVTDGAGRFFILSSAPAMGVPPVQGHVRGIIHRHALIVREVPSQQAVQVMIIMCGEPGGRIPNRVVDIARGEGKKIVEGIRAAIVQSSKKIK